MEVTRRSVLLEALGMNEARLAEMSRDRKGLEPLAGRGDEWREAQEKCAVLRDMIRALESEYIRKALAHWQMKLMADEEKAKRDAMAELDPEEWTGNNGPLPGMTIGIMYRGPHMFTEFDGYCEKCGELLHERYEYCPGCGRRIVWQEKEGKHDKRAGEERRGQD